jgi:16S rRNA (cytosine1402-N4)-methyltransferase
MPQEYHTPVLSGEVFHFLYTSPDGIYVDGTLGGGGHAENILMNSSSHAALIGFDLDPEAVAFSLRRLERFSGRVRVVHDSYANLNGRLRELRVDRISGLLLDLGVSSWQIDQNARGFSFQNDGPLDMRMDPGRPLTAREVVNGYDEKRLAAVIWNYGEERASRRIARAVAAARVRGPIETTGSLASVIGSAVGGRMLTKTLARVFQALRIEVNDELGNLRKCLADALDVLQEGGRIVVISYHSLEDRIVKQFFRAASARVEVPATKLLPVRPRKPLLNVLTPRPVVASEEEVRANPRARSAKLRAAERTER